MTISEKYKVPPHEIAKWGIDDWSFTLLCMSNHKEETAITEKYKSLREDKDEYYNNKVMDW